MSPLFDAPARLRRLRASMASAGIDCMVVVDRFNSLYMSGFSCSNSIALVGARAAVFLTDFRYIERARAEIRGFNVRLVPQNLDVALTDAISALDPKTIGFEGNLPYFTFVRLKRAAKRRRLQESGELIARMRSVKSDAEIAVIQANQRLNERVLHETLSEVRLGLPEERIRRIVRTRMAAAGGEEGFETIVAAGANSSSPHAVAGSAKTRRGELLLIDMGVKRNHYHSDMTRTFSIGKARPGLHRIYDVVLEAQLRALALIREGAIASDIDAAARNYISSQGFGEYFGHGLGHSLGLEIHESPALNSRNHEPLQVGMVVTVEPGVYVPGTGGVRIEDFVVVTPTGYRNLTRFPKRELTRIA